MSHRWFSTVHDLTLELVRFPSVTASPGEGAFGAHLHGLITRHPYFAANPDDVWTEAAGEHSNGRRNVFALVRGEGAGTVVLSGHYDVVSVEGYGALESWAFDPLELLPRLIATLETNASSEADRLALADLKSGAFLPGRGVLDMKSGLAAGLAVLQGFAETPERRGNLLFVATPDEEATSDGMRAAALRLSSIAQERGLALRAALNLDAIGDRKDGSEGQAVCFGSAGKLLTSVYLVGCETHAAYPFDGLNANRLAAEVVRRLDSNPDLCDFADGEWASAPANLRQTDEKTHYDVTVPITAWTTFNILSYARRPAQVMELMRQEVTAALEEVVCTHEANARRYAERSGTEVVPGGAPLVLTYAELRERVLQTAGAGALELLENQSQRLAADPDVDLPEHSRRLTKALWTLSGLSGAAAVLGFAALYYPAVRVDEHKPLHKRLRETVARAVAGLEHDTGTRVALRPFFPAISDMSFLSSADSHEDLAVMMGNTPPWGAALSFDYTLAGLLDLPTVNVGPWGRDYHQRTERLYMPYSFEALPELLHRLALGLLEEG